MAGHFIVLFTDFGPAGPYTGQMQAVLRQQAPDSPIIDLASNAPSANPKAASYLLAALRHSFPKESVFLCVVDPGVGGPRRSLVLSADGHYFVGPDNGLLNTVARHARTARWQLIDWQPDHCSASFHGRDLFAPIAARLANGTADPFLRPSSAPTLDDWPDDLSEIIYFDVYGNAMTGQRFRPEMSGLSLLNNDRSIDPAETFSAVSKGQPFWYRNSCGLVEIAVNQGSAEHDLSLHIGDTIEWAAP